MKYFQKTKHRKLFATLALGISALLFAAAVFIPSTQPTVTLGKYVLVNPDLLNSGTIAYRPWFENGAWQGDIVEYEVLQDGTRRTDASVEATAPATGTKGWCYRSDSGCWSARATFIDNGADNTADSTDISDSYWKKREIITTDGQDNQKPFTWDQLSTTQRAALDQDTVDLVAQSVASNDDLYASVILNFIRGQRFNERINDGFLRTRSSVLGDITNTPVYIGPPRELLDDLPGYSAFATATDIKDRPGRIAAGSNDGMLHIFSEDDGSEVFAYIPSMVIDKLSRLAARYEAYQHTYYVDGEPNAGSAQIGTEWRTILTGGGGAGFAGLYALDMTDPDFGPNKILFEKSAADGFGYIYGKPKIVPLGNDNGDPDWHPNWYIITGNGYGTGDKYPTELTFISLDTHTSASVQVAQVNGNGNGGLSTPTLVSVDSDVMPELAFAGDINGNLWMFEINQDNPGSSTATKVYSGDTDHPITSAPIVAVPENENGLMVYFGTGSILSMSDALNDGLDNNGNLKTKQAVYGIWVDTSNMTTLKTGLPYTSSKLQAQTLDETPYTYTFTDPDTGDEITVAKTVRYVPDEKPVNYRCPFPSISCTLHKGWKVELPNCGERLVGDPFLRAGRLQFVTTNPTGLHCGERTLEGDSWVMSLNYTTGADNQEIVYNLNDDDFLNEGDTVIVGTEHKPPVGLSLGPGNISQPAFARLSKGVDKMFINGLIMSVPIPNPGPLLAGHLDVETDSPTDGVIAANEVSKHSEGYMVTENDGIGKAVDGHVHDYDGINGVNYVDLFQLEPRRGKANLVATLVDTSISQPCDSSTVNRKGTLVDNTCIQLVEGELNRAYDTLHTDGDGNMDPVFEDANGDDLPAVWQSEVNSLNSSTPPDYKNQPNKKFIVVLANADLSNAGILQIGCKVWPVVDYQNMITAKLQAMTGGPITNLVDNDGDSLIFTMNDPDNNGIMDQDPSTCPGGANAPDNEMYSKEFAIAKGLSATPTLRIGFGTRSIIDGGILPTRSQCVLGLHNYAETVCYTDKEVLEASSPDKFPLPAAGYVDYPSCNYTDKVPRGDKLPPPPTPPVDYLRDPRDNLHVTYIQGKGRRWRNGALTVQLIDSSIDPSKDLQTPATMVNGAGTFAKAFDLSTLDPRGFTNSTGPFANSGLLYEATMFWHYSELVDRLRNSDPVNNHTPPEGGCYSGPGYGGKSGGIEGNGANPAEVKNLLDALQKECVNNDACRLQQFLTLLEQIGNAETEDKRNQYLADLANMLADPANADLKKLNDLWDYIPDDKKPQLGDGGTSKTISDGTPAEVVSIETIDLKARGPNYTYGRRNWIDIRQ